VSIESSVHDESPPSRPSYGRQEENATPKVEVFDPPMCCSTGVCGPAVDPSLVRFAADLDWLKKHGVEVARFNLAQEPGAFVSNPVVAGALRERNDILPPLLVDGVIASRGSYPVATCWRSLQR